MSERNGKKVKGAFFVPRQAIEIMLGMGNEAKFLIPAYLKLASHTDSSGMYTTAGHTCLKNTLRQNNNTAQNFIKKLIKLKLVRELNDKDLEMLNMAETKNADLPCNRKIRWVIDDFNEDRGDCVWFSRGLTEGLGEFKNPLRALAQCGADACRMFVYLQSQYKESLNACDPYRSVYKMYAPTGSHWCTNYIIKEWQSPARYLTHATREASFRHLDDFEGLDGLDTTRWDEKNSDWAALDSLLAEGFVYYTAVVCDSPIKPRQFVNEFEHDIEGNSEYCFSDVASWDYKNLSELTVVYELCDEDRFSNKTPDLYQNILNSVEKLGEVRKASKYSIMKINSSHSVIGLLRPRFMPVDTKNPFIIQAEKDRAADRKDAMRWLYHFNLTKGLNDSAAKDEAA